MRRKFKLILFASLLILSSLCGIGFQTGRASQLSGDEGAALPPRPTPVVNGQTASHAEPDLLVSMSAYPGEAKIGDQVTFTIQISNPEKEKVGGIDAWGLLPAEFEVQGLSSSAGTIWINPDTLRTRAFIKPLPGKKSVTLTIRTRVSSQANPSEKYYAATWLTYGDQGAHKVFSNWVTIRIVGH